MSSTTILTLVIVALIALGGIVLLTTSRRNDTRSATGSIAGETKARERARKRAEKSARKDGVDPLPLPPSGRAYEKAVVRVAQPEVELVNPYRAPELIRPPLDADALGVSRRQFLNRGTITMFLLGLGGFGGAVLTFLWPTGSSGFGSKINVGKLDDILADIESKKVPLYVAVGRTYIVPYPAAGLSKAEAVYTGGVLEGMKGGVVALYQKCPHLGCKVPWCETSQWFECPCHGSQYNRVGEKKGGPAPRGMDRFAVAISDGNIIVDTGARTEGPAIGINTSGQEAEGPHCV